VLLERARDRSPTRMRPVGYVFGYGTLADAADPLVLRTRWPLESMDGHLRGFRRRWRAAMENRAPLNDHKHYVDPDGTRPDICVVTLDISPGDGDVNGIALPVDEAALMALDRRELRYDRIDVTHAFSAVLGASVWTYTAKAEARLRYAASAARGRAFVRRGYLERVERTFRGLGEQAWSDYRASTDPPDVPLRHLEHLHVGVELGG
jgi:hypothetical protein